MALWSTHLFTDHTDILWLRIWQFKYQILPDADWLSAWQTQKSNTPKCGNKMSVLKLCKSVSPFALSLQSQVSVWKFFSDIKREQLCFFISCILRVSLAIHTKRNFSIWVSPLFWFFVKIYLMHGHGAASLFLSWNFCIWVGEHFVPFYSYCATRPTTWLDMMDE